MLGMGLPCIRFAIREPNLFRFHFRSGFAVENSLTEMVYSKKLKPVLAMMQGAMEMDIKQVKEVFVTISLFAHGYASIIANSSLTTMKFVWEYIYMAATVIGTILYCIYLRKKPAAPHGRQ